MPRAELYAQQMMSLDMGYALFLADPCGEYDTVMPGQVGEVTLVEPLSSRSITDDQILCSKGREILSEYELEDVGSRQNALSKTA